MTGPNGVPPLSKPPQGPSGISKPQPQRIEVTTPAERPPMLQTPAEPAAASGQGIIAEILERLEVIEDQLGITRRKKGKGKPLPGSTVEPLTDEA